MRGGDPHIRRLLLASCGLADAALALLALGISDHRHLECLDVAHNPAITDAGIDALCSLAFASPFRKPHAG